MDEGKKAFQVTFKVNFKRMEGTLQSIAEFISSMELMLSK